MYTVFMRDTQTGEEREIPIDLPWHESSGFWWAEGNYSCDCNRALEFERSKGNEPELDSVECSDGLYVVDKIVSDGKIVYRDEVANA